MAKKINKRRLNDQSVNFIASNQCNQVNNSYAGHRTLEEELNKVAMFNQAWSRAIQVNEQNKWDNTVEYLAKTCWTIASPPFFKLVNEELREWFLHGDSNSAGKLFPFNNYVKLLEKQCVQLGEMKILYRGIDHKNLSLELCEKGENNDKYLTSPCMYSCSEEQQTAIDFASKGFGTLLKIETDYGIEIKEYSNYKYEKEILIPAGLSFKVLSYTYNKDSYDVIRLRLAQATLLSGIRNDLALDISHRNLKLRQYDPNSVKQLWFIQGRYIRNKENGDVLDFDHIKTDQNEHQGKEVVTYRLHCQKNQEWFFTENHIENGINELVMHVEGQVEDGSSIVVRTKTNCDNQLFKIVYN